MPDTAILQCIRPACAATYDLHEPLYACTRCGALLDVAYDWSRLVRPGHLSFFEDRWRKRNEPLDFSGVWRFRELLPFAPETDLVTLGEGQTPLHSPDPARLDIPLKTGRLHFQYEGMNPSGSFKDNGMAAAFTMARRLGRRRVACASTGNTSASLALFAAQTRLPTGAPMRAIVFIGTGKIAHGKLAQALDFGALTLQIDGDFDACLARIREAADPLNLYLMNSLNPIRLEGQKTIMYRVLESLAWEPPDWIIVPGGNLGNAGAFGKAFAELRDLGLCARIPRLAVVNAAGANTLSELFNRRNLRWNNGNWDDAIIAAHRNEMAVAGRRARTIASAIEIADPVNLPKALRALDVMNGRVVEVTDAEILDEKARIGRTGFGCEPASAASLAGLRRLIAQGDVAPDDRVVCILTGHALKDPDATVGYHMAVEPPARMGSPTRTSAPAKSDAPDESPALGGQRQHPAAKFANRPIRVADDLDAICRIIEQHDPQE